MAHGGGLPPRPPTEQRPPVEREERALPLWLAVREVIRGWSHDLWGGWSDLDLSLSHRGASPCFT